MDFWTVEKGELVRYRRTGQCKQCGQCCYQKRITFSMAVGAATTTGEGTSQEDKDWSSREGWSIFYAQGIWWYFIVQEIAYDAEKRCPKLSEELLCEEWMDPVEFRPICRYWPFHPSDLEMFPDCGFSFERMDD